MKAFSDLWRRSPAMAVAIAIGILVAFRLVVVIASPLEIGPDEAQYWRWSRTLDFGYYSKPPLIAWVIWLSTSVFGDGAWAAVIYLLMPGVWLSSAVISTDAVLLVAWAPALYFLWRLREKPRLANG